MSDETILPRSSSPLEFSMERAVAFVIDAIPQEWGGLSASTAPRDLLGHVAWALSVDNWQDEWSDEVKRSVVATSILIHREKGTVPAILRALSVSGFPDALLVEHHPGISHDGSVTHDGSRDGVPADHWAEYRLYLSRPVTLDQAQFVRDILATVAPAHSHLKGLFYERAAHRHNGAIVHDGTFAHGVAT